MSKTKAAKRAPATAPTRVPKVDVEPSFSYFDGSAWQPIGNRDARMLLDGLRAGHYTVSLPGLGIADVGRMQLLRDRAQARVANLAWSGLTERHWWEWEASAGVWQPYLPHECAALDRAVERRDAGIELKVGLRQFRIDLSTDVQRGTRRTRAVRRPTVPVREYADTVIRAIGAPARAGAPLVELDAAATELLTPLALERGVSAPDEAVEALLADDTGDWAAADAAAVVAATATTGSLVGAAGSHGPLAEEAGAAVEVVLDTWAAAAPGRVSEEDRSRRRAEVAQMVCAHYLPLLRSVVLRTALRKFWVTYRATACAVRADVPHTRDGFAHCSVWEAGSDLDGRRALRSFAFYAPTRPLPGAARVLDASVASAVPLFAWPSTGAQGDGVTGVLTALSEECPHPEHAADTSGALDAAATQPLAGDASEAHVVPWIAAAADARSAALSTSPAVASVRPVLVTLARAPSLASGRDGCLWLAGAASDGLVLPPGWAAERVLTVLADAQGASTLSSASVGARLEQLRRAESTGAAGTVRTIVRCEEVPPPAPPDAKAGAQQPAAAAAASDARRVTVSCPLPRLVEVDAREPSGPHFVAVDAALAPSPHSAPVFAQIAGLVDAVVQGVSAALIVMGPQGFAPKDSTLLPSAKEGLVQLCVRALFHKVARLKLPGAVLSCAVVHAGADALARLQQTVAVPTAPPLSVGSDGRHPWIVAPLETTCVSADEMVALLLRALSRTSTGDSGGGGTAVITDPLVISITLRAAEAMGGEATLSIVHAPASAAPFWTEFDTRVRGLGHSGPSRRAGNKDVVVSLLAALLTSAEVVAHALLVLPQTAAAAPELLAYLGRLTALRQLRAPGAAPHPPPSPPRMALTRDTRQLFWQLSQPDIPSAEAAARPGNDAASAVAPVAGPAPGMAASGPPSGFAHPDPGSFRKLALELIELHTAAAGTHRGFEFRAPGSFKLRLGPWCAEANRNNSRYVVVMHATHPSRAGNAITVAGQSRGVFLWSPGPGRRQEFMSGATGPVDPQPAAHLSDDAIDKTDKDAWSITCAMRNELAAAGGSAVFRGVAVPDGCAGVVLRFMSLLIVLLAERGVVLLVSAADSRRGSVWVFQPNSRGDVVYCPGGVSAVMHLPTGA